MLENFAPTIPDYALDMCTMKGKATADDPYEGEAYRWWAIKQQQR
jgi:hypothetical protein